MADDTTPSLDAPPERGGGDPVKDPAEDVPGRLVACEVEGQIDAGRCERDGERTTLRDGHRHRSFDARPVTCDPKTPKLREGPRILTAPPSTGRLRAPWHGSA